MSKREQGTADSTAQEYANIKCTVFEGDTTVLDTYDWVHASLEHSIEL